MSIKLSEIVSGERAITLPIGASELNITYSMAERSPAAMANDTFDDPWIVRALVSWDLLDDTGVPLPIDADTLRQVPRPVLKRIMDAIYEDDGLGEAESSSDAG